MGMWKCKYCGYIGWTDSSSKDIVSAYRSEMCKHLILCNEQAKIELIDTMNKHVGFSG